MFRGLKAAAVFAAAMGATGAGAATVTFDVAWSAETGLRTSDPSLRATGVIEIADVGNGALFDLSDLVRLTVEVVGDTIATTVFDGTAPDIILSGRVAADGRSAAILDLFVGEFDVTGFGCDAPNCAETLSSGPRPVAYNIASARQPDGTLATTLYGAPADALASFVLTRQMGPAVPDPDPLPGPEPAPAPAVIPLPGTAPLLLAGLAGLVILRRKRRALA